MEGGIGGGELRYHQIALPLLPQKFLLLPTHNLQRQPPALPAFNWMIVFYGLQWVERASNA